MFGALALVGGFGGILGDVFLLWSTGTSVVAPFSVETETYLDFFAHKSELEYLVGSLLGAIVMPMHLAGVFLAYLALRPHGGILPGVFVALGAYLTAVAAGFHGSLGYVAGIVAHGNLEAQSWVSALIIPWGGTLFGVYVITSLLLFWMVFSGRTLYSRWWAFMSPFSLLVFFTALAAMLPEPLGPLRAFLAVTALSAPLVFWYVLTVRVLLREKGIEKN